MSKVCESSGKKPRSGGFKYVRSGIPKKQGGIGLKIRGKTLRWFRPNIQRIRVLLPNGDVRRMNLARFRCHSPRSYRTRWGWPGV